LIGADAKLSSLKHCFPRQRREFLFDRRNFSLRIFDFLILGILVFCEFDFPKTQITAIILALVPRLPDHLAKA
jgi:hypothetical protein